MKRIIVALLVGGALAVTVAFAASLGGVTSGDLGAGSGPVASCDTGGVGTEYTVAFSGGSFRVTDVKVTGIDASCNNQTVDIELTDGGVGVGSASGIADGSGSMGPVSVSPQPVAENVDDVHVAIHD